MQLGCSLPTMRRVFREELAHGKDTVVGRIATRLIQKALRGDNACMMFYLRLHGGPAWQERQRHEHSGPDGMPLQPPSLIVGFLPRKPEG